jgi:tRNA(fMet)-specific endonuclease VapC
MPRYMLDTTMCIYLMKNQPEEVARRFAQCYVGDVMMSAITYAELEYGVAVSAEPEHERVNLAALVDDIQVVPFDVPAGVAYGPIRLATRDSKKDHLDKMIAGPCCFAWRDSGDKQPQGLCQVSGCDYGELAGPWRRSCQSLRDAPQGVRNPSTGKSGYPK